MDRHPQGRLRRAQALGESATMSDYSPRRTRAVGQCESSEGKKRHTFFPLRQVVFRKAGKSPAQRQTQITQSVLGTSLSSPVGSFRTFQVEDLPLREDLFQWRLPQPKALRSLMRPSRQSESCLRRAGAVEAATLLSKEFPGKKVKRRPAIIGHLPYLIKKRLMVTGGL